MKFLFLPRRLSGRSVVAAALLGATVLTVAPVALAQTVIFDNASAGTGLADRSGSAPIAGITVSAATTINAIAVRNDLEGRGSIKFLIYQNPVAASAAGPNNTPVFSTGAKVFADDGLSSKQSDFFSFTLRPGNQYYIGGIANVDAAWAFDFDFNTQNGITSSGNGNAVIYANPFYAGSAQGDAQIQLLQGGNAAAPEPSALAFLATGLSLAVLVLYRRPTPV